MTIQSTQIKFLEVDNKNIAEELDMLKQTKLSLVDEVEENITVGDNLKRALDDLQNDSNFDKEQSII